MAPRARRLLLAVVALLYLLSIPWYREPGAAPDPDGWLATRLGLPDWVVVALLCYVAVAALNAVAWGLAPIEEPGPRGRERGR